MSESPRTVPGLTWCGIIGSAMATTLSWDSWHSVVWMFLHAVCGWFYVAYWCIRHRM